MSANHYFIAQRDEAGLWHVFDTYQRGNQAPEKVAGPFRDAGAALSEAIKCNNCHAALALGLIATGGAACS